MDRVRQFRGADGRPLTFGVPAADPEAGHASGVVVRTEQEQAMTTKAEQTGVYVLGGHRFHIQAGDVLPEGAELEAADEQRAIDKAPETKSTPSAPENRAKGGEK